MTFQLIDVSKRYGKKEAIRGLNLTIAPGSVVGLVGLNGSGKTTTLKLLSGLLRPNSGVVRILDAPPQKNRGILAFHSELDTVYPWLNPARGERFMQGLYPDFKVEKYRQLLATLEVPDQRNDEMSKGQKSRFKLAMTLARSVQLLLLDEPLSGIDPISRRKIMETLLGESRGGAAMVISTHEIEIAQDLFDRVVILHNGQIALDKGADELRSGHMNIVDVFEKAIQ
jgi:ABC-2 type transport system ATP-binding protein